jgi:hypothetical protein
MRPFDIAYSLPPGIPGPHARRFNGESSAEHRRRHSGQVPIGPGPGGIIAAYLVRSHAHEAHHLARDIGAGWIVRIGPGGRLARILGRARAGQAEAHGRRLPVAGRGLPAVHETDDRPHPGRLPEGLAEAHQRQSPPVRPGGRRAGAEDPGGCAHQLRRCVRRGIHQGRLHDREGAGTGRAAHFHRGHQPLHQRAGHDVRGPLLQLHRRGRRGHAGPRSARLPD